MVRSSWICTRVISGSPCAARWWASAGPLTGSLAGITKLAEAGVGAVVLPSLFQEQLPTGDERDWFPAEGGADSRGDDADSRDDARKYFRDLGGPGGGTGLPGTWP